MKVALECIPCTVQSCLRLLEEGDIDENLQEDLLRQTLRFLAEADWEQSPPALAGDLQTLLRRAAEDPDPYRVIKRRGNQAMLELVPELRAELARASDPLGMALRLAVAGNVIAKGQGNLEGLWDADRDIFFLLTVKCERIARKMGVPVGAFVVWNRRAQAG